MRIHLSEEENIVLSAATVRRLIAAGSSDAALLYLTLLLHHGSMLPEKLTEELGWSPQRLSQAEAALLSGGLVNSHRPAAAAERSDEERPDYTREDVSRQLESDGRFAQLTGNVEQLLGKKLSSSDLNILLGLYDYLGLPCEVIFLLVGHCTERMRAKYGEGRRPTLRQVEREGYAWARMGLMDLESANVYLMKYARKKTQTAQYMQVMGLGQRLPSPTEENYLLQWAEMGFPAEAVELAYDKTILKCRELRWGYMNKILCNWHEKGLHSREEIGQGDSPRPSAPTAAKPEKKAGENLERMKKYLEESRK